MSLKVEFCCLLKSGYTISDVHIKEKFGERFQLLAPIIEEMLGSKQLVLVPFGDVIYYRHIREENALKLEDLR